MPHRHLQGGPCCPDVHTCVENAGLVAQTVNVQNQTINVAGRPEWIQQLDVDQLKKARARLYRASRRHEIMAIMPIVLPCLVGLILVCSVAVVYSKNGLTMDAHERTIVFSLAGLLALPLWFALYDVRRRHRQVVAAAERRWAEIEVEISLRDTAKPSNGRRLLAALKGLFVSPPSQ